MSFKELLDTNKRNLVQFYPTFEQLYKTIQKHRDTIATLEDNIVRIEASIFGKENMSSYETDMG